MARSRNIKPGFFKNEDLLDLPYEYRLLFVGLWTLADREGYLEDRPKRIRMLPTSLIPPGKWPSGCRSSSTGWMNWMRR